jgi:DNA polymerase V
MYALVDAVAFYASAEKVFDPSIRNKPVVVLTNNDGCICAVCPIARKLGIPKFKPYFELQGYLAKHQVVVRSSNYELYADLSDKMMNVIARFCDNQHVYSIDECFLQFNGYQIMNDWHQYGHLIRQTVWRETKLPVGVGFGVTSTLAKAANHAAKKLSGFHGVAVIDNEQSRVDILSRMQVTDVWGVGNRLGKKLNAMGINSALDLAKQSPKTMRKFYSVVLERTVRELNGDVCLHWDDVRAPKQAIFSTRSFGQRVTEQHDLQSALITHCSIVAKKLRQQHCLAKRLLIFAHSSPHEENYYKKSSLVDFPVPTANTLTISTAVAQFIPYLYQTGVRFYKCGVGAIEVITEQYYQADLFTQHNERSALLSCLDTINQRYGDNTLRLASAENTRSWAMKREFLSPRFTTRWQDIPKIYCD